MIFGILVDLLQICTYCMFDPEYTYEIWNLKKLRNFYKLIQI